MGIHRKTESLDVLLNEFNNSLKAISAVDLVNRLSNKMNKTTIYRLLKKLEEDFVLHSFFGKNGLKWYAKCGGCCKSGSESIAKKIQPHFQCLTCGKIDLLSVELKILDATKHLKSASQFLIQGKCESCV